MDKKEFEIIAKYLLKKQGIICSGVIIRALHMWAYESAINALGNGANQQECRELIEKSKKHIIERLEAEKAENILKTLESYAM